MKRIAYAALTLLLSSLAAFGQVPYFPQSLPAGTIVGRMPNAGAGPTEAIPFASLGLSPLPPKTFFGNNTSNSVLGFSITGDLAEQLMLFTEPGTGAVQRTLDAKVKDFAISLADFGAIGNGVADDTTAINNAVASLPATGGKILLTPGKTYCVTNTVTLGNGSGTSQSTTSGFYFETVGQSFAPDISGNMNPKSSFKWCGAATPNTVINILGPLSQWGFRNVVIDCNSLAGIGLQITAINDGDVEHVAINNCTAFGLLAKSRPVAAGGNINTQQNYFKDLQILLANANNAIGMQLDGDQIDGASNTSLNVFDNFVCWLPSSATGTTCLVAKDSDSNVFRNLQIYTKGATGNCIVFDYTGHNSGLWPANYSFLNYDPGGLANCTANTLYSNNGSPAAGARPHRFYDVLDTNGPTYPKIANTTYTPEMINPGVALTGQTASIGTTNFTSIPIYVAGMYRLSYYYQVTTSGTGGTVGTTLGWTSNGVGYTDVGNAINLNAANFFSRSVFVRADSGSNFTYTTTVSGATGNPQYELFVKAEKLD